MKVIEGASITADQIVSADVCVIGSGCGGASLAMRLSERGYRVVILEQGGYYPREELDQREVHSLAKIDGGRGLHTSDHAGVALTYGNNIGGASVHYWADSYRTPSDRLALWADGFGLQGHGLDVLTPHFAQIEADLHVHPAEDGYANTMNLKVRDAATGLGWDVARVPQARRACAKSGYCHQGCSYDAKQSQMVTYLPRAAAAGAQIYADCRAVLLHRDGPKVQAVSAAVLDRATGQRTGRMVRVDARAVVVAAGGYGTPELLLSQGYKDRLPSLGEHFFCNPCPQVYARFDEEIVLWRNIPAAWAVEGFRLARHEGGPTGAPTGFFGDQGTYLEGGYLLMPNQLQPALLAAVLPGVGATHRALMRDLPRLGGTIAWIDDAEPGRVTWDGQRRRIWVPLIGGNALRIRDAWKKQAKLLFAAGAREVLFADADDTRVSAAAEIDATVDRISLRPGRNLFAAPHPGGACRMGVSENDSVVGMDHRVHSTDNLYVADGSVFPTGPSVDPSLSILAFSFVAADAVAQALG